MTSQDFVEAAFRGDLEAVETAIRQGLPIEAHGKLERIRNHRNGQVFSFSATSPLMAAIACRKSNRKVIVRLIEADADLRGDWTHAPLPWAMHLHAYEHAYLLLDHIENPFAGDQNPLREIRPRRLTKRLLQKSPSPDNLAFALKNSGPKAYARAVTLLKAGANLNYRFFDGGLPVHTVTDPGVIRALAQHGADFESLHGRNEFTPSESAGWTALGAQLRIPWGDKIEALLEVGCNVNFIHESGMSILMYALSSWYRSALVIELLLGAGADAFYRNQGWSMMHYVNSSSEIDDGVAVLQVLSKAGLPIDMRSDDGATALHYACLKHRLSTACALLAAGADVNSRIEADPADGRTPLMLASHSPEAVTELLNHGADPSLTCSLGKTAFDYAKEWLDQIYEPGWEEPYDITVTLRLTRIFSGEEDRSPIGDDFDSRPLWVERMEGSLALLRNG